MNINKEKTKTREEVPARDSSPINGFMGIEGVKVLNEELDKLSPRYYFINAFFLYIFIFFVYRFIYRFFLFAEKLIPMMKTNGYY